MCFLPMPPMDVAYISFLYSFLPFSFTILYFLNSFFPPIQSLFDLHRQSTTYKNLPQYTYPTFYSKQTSLSKRWRHRQIHFASSHNQKKEWQQILKKKQPELPENQAVWKTNIQGVKEETFIQTGRRGGDGKSGQGRVWQGSRLQVRRWFEHWLVPHSQRGQWETSGQLVQAFSNKMNKLWGPNIQHSDYR